MINRELLTEEEVHHIDFNRQNNNTDNLMIFSSKEDHQRYHAGGILIPNGDGTYRCKERTIACPICNKEFHPYSDQIYCSKKCCNESKKRMDKPSKEELLELLYEYSFEAIGAKYNVSSNAIRKWCKSYAIPHNAQHYRKKKEQPKSRIKRLSDEQKIEAIKLYKEGYTQIELAEKYNVSRWQIRITIKECE